MPFKQYPRPLNNVLTALIDDLGIQPQLDKARIVEAWATMAGPRINGLTDSAWVKGDRLFIKLTSSVWRHELHLQRRAWCERLNENLGTKLVREIVFR